MQKSRIGWLRYGDWNTKFSHTSMLVRRRRNKIEMFRDADRNWVEDGEALKNMAVDHFSELFRADSMRGWGFIKGAFPQLESGVKEDMGEEDMGEEIHIL